MPVSTLNTAVLAALERAIGQALEMDPSSRQAVADLDGQVLHLRCDTPEFDAYIMPGAAGITLRASYEGEVHCSVRGSASGFLEVASARDKAAALINGGLSVSGDTAALLRLQEILANLEVDWEGRLATVIGDVAAHQLGRALRGSARFGQQAGTRLRRHVDEFIHEEARLAPPRAEVEDFYADVQALGVRVQRLDARLKRQQRRIDALTTSLRRDK